MLNLSKLTILASTCIGLTACGSLGETLGKLGERHDGALDNLLLQSKCPLEIQFCKFDDAELRANPPAVGVDVDVLQISSADLGVEGPDQKSGLLKDIAAPEIADERYYNVRYAEVTRADGNGADDGFAYYSLAGSNSDPIQYVGILPTTDLGNALNYRLPLSPLAVATWKAKLVLVEPNSQSRTESFDMVVNFASRTISAQDIEIPRGDDFSNSRTGSFDGDFGVAGDKTNTPGQINGTFDIDGDTLDSAKMYGLIGEEGAVGVFSGTYFGGFVASPQ